MQALAVPMPTEIERHASKFKGGGSSKIWYRWGYVAAPAGYDWAGAKTAFPSDEDYMKVVEGTTPKKLADVTSGTLDAVRGTWDRKFESVLSLGILPVFHS